MLRQHHLRVLVRESGMLVSLSQLKPVSIISITPLVTELMSNRHKSLKIDHPARLENIPGVRRGALYEYIARPETFSSERVIYYNADFVAIRDLFPKAMIHTLLLPRNDAYTQLHPFDAFEDDEFLASVRAETEKLKKLVASELRRRLGQFSTLDAAREAVLTGDVELDEDASDLPSGRCWSDSVMAGIHAHPSMQHLHVHVMSVDLAGTALKHRKHYNSFATPFFVPLEAFPLARDDPRRCPDEQGYLKKHNLVCWACGEDFGNRFVALKAHLAEEFESWKNK